MQFCLQYDSTVWQCQQIVGLDWLYAAHKDT